jgi:hypothetical protein
MGAMGNPPGIFASVNGQPADVLRAHVGPFNDAVRSQDYSEMVAGFAADAEMAFQGIPVGPFVGREAIAHAYASRPPRGEVRLLGAPDVRGDVVESTYAWAGDDQPAGRMIVTVQNGQIVRLVVTFDEVRSSRSRRPTLRHQPHD